jgi:hypothetical protein
MPRWGSSAVGRLRELLRRRDLWGERGALIALLALVAVIYVLSSTLPVRPLPIAAQTLPIVLGNLLLELRTLRPLLTVIIVAVLASLLELGFNETRLGSVIVVAIVALVVAGSARRRERLGLVGVRGDALLADLRDRLAPMAVIPVLPAGWHADVATRLAGGMTFGGDLVVTHAGGDVLQVALVDVSGSGVAAATRALQLSGALGSLVGAVAPEAFLPAANRYVLRQDWEDGFATAVHLTLDTRTGAYALRSAGHPPAAVFRALSGGWELADPDGPALGLLEAASYAPELGVLHFGDTLLVYTDGMVEVAGEDLQRGIDRLLGAATSLVVDRFRGGARRLLDAVPDSAGDDRAVVVVWRD